MKHKSSNDEFDLIDEEIESSEDESKTENDKITIIDVDKMTNIPVIRENVKCFGEYMKNIYDTYIKEDMNKYIEKYKLKYDLTE
jgi:uncharacterized pyridoxal phosphate-containing UPF0001 family protein